MDHNHQNIFLSHSKIFGSHAGLQWSIVGYVTWQRIYCEKGFM